MSPRVRPTGEEALRRRLHELIERWDAPEEHTDWCCSKGCVQPTGFHAVVEFIHLEGQVHPIVVAERDCPGECTCVVGAYIRQLREAMQ
jgi:hypothetical protein